MIRFLIANALRQDISKKGADLKEDISLADKSFVAAMAFFNNCSTVELCDHYIETIVRDYPQSYSFPGSDEKKSIIQNGFLTLLHVILLHNLVMSDGKGIEEITYFSTGDSQHI